MGLVLRFLTAGESHGPGLTVVVDGLPAGVPVEREAIDADLRRRQGGYGRGGRMKIETDAVEILSGIRHGRSLGSPVSLVVRNRDHENWADVMSPDPQPPSARERRRLRFPRPGHADLAGALKYGTDDLRNVLERASARETTARVAAGALAKALLRATGTEVRSHVVRIGIDLVSGPFRRLRGEWRFVPAANGADISLTLTFEVTLSPFGVVFAKVFEELAAAQMAAFISRAATVYGGASREPTRAGDRAT